MLKAVSEAAEVTQKDIEKVLKAFEEVVITTLSGDKEEKITLGSLGSFKVKEVAERTGTIMMGQNKGETYTTPAHSEISFKMSKTTKQLN